MKTANQNPENYTVERMPLTSGAIDAVREIAIWSRRGAGYVTDRAGSIRTFASEGFARGVANELNGHAVPEVS